MKPRTRLSARLVCAVTLGGAMLLATAGASLGMTSPAQAQPAVETELFLLQTVVGTEYKDSGYSDFLFNVAVSGDFNCDSGTDTLDVWVGDLSSSDNDEISSFRTWAGCQARHWQDNWFGGPSTGWQTDDPQINSPLNDETSSIGWS